MGLFYIETAEKPALVKGHLNGDLNEARQGASRTTGKASRAAGTAGAKALRRRVLTCLEGEGGEEASRLDRETTSEGRRAGTL